MTANHAMMVHGSRFQYQWGGTGGAWANWSDANTDPLAYTTTDANAGQTLICDDLRLLWARLVEQHRVLITPIQYKPC